uniref:Uncharacterized protein n=1 Tax=Brassica oleracea var. oleracea TaxID=109376 RepID=A0A0D3B291_BRAOL
MVQGSYSDVVERGKDHKERGGVMGDVNVDDNDAILKSFLAEVGEVERDNEVVSYAHSFNVVYRLLILTVEMVYPYDSLMLQAKPTPLSISTYLSILPPMMLKDSTESLFQPGTLLPYPLNGLIQLPKLPKSLLLSYRLTWIGLFQPGTLLPYPLNGLIQLPKLPKSLLLSYRLTWIGYGKFWLRFGWYGLYGLGKDEQIYEQSEEFQKELKLKVREILTDQEWRRRKMAMRISEEERRLKKDEEEQKEIWKKKREHEAQWEGTREKRVSSWRDFMKAGKKAKKGETRPPKLKTDDPNKGRSRKADLFDSFFADLFFIRNMEELYKFISVLKRLFTF